MISLTHIKNAFARSYSWSQSNAPLPPAPNVFILYGDTINWGWLGGMYALKLENLLAHFESKVTKKPFGQYLIGDLAKYDATFYPHIPKRRFHRSFRRI